MSDRPGSASVQYDDVRGEAAGDVADQLSNSLQEAAKQLGFPGGGFVVGMSIYAGQGSQQSDPNPVYVTVQAVPDIWGVDDVNKKLAETGGELVVNEYSLPKADIRDVLRCFKRFQIGLFCKGIKAKTVSVAEEIDVEADDDRLSN